MQKLHIFGALIAVALASIFFSLTLGLVLLNIISLVAALDFWQSRMQAEAQISQLKVQAAEFSRKERTQAAELVWNIFKLFSIATQPFCRHQSLQSRRRRIIWFKKWKQITKRRKMHYFKELSRWRKEAVRKWVVSTIDEAVSPYFSSKGSSRKNS